MLKLFGAKVILQHTKPARLRQAKAKNVKINQENALQKACTDRLAQLESKGLNLLSLCKVILFRRGDRVAEGA